MTQIETHKGRFYGVGVGTGDPELLTLKAWRCIKNADMVCYLCNDTGFSQAKYIAREALNARDTVPDYLPITMPMRINRQAANEAYDQARINIKRALEKNKNVVFLCEGDPLFFGSLNYLLLRLQDYPCEVIAGISSIHAASARLAQPLTMQQESLAVVSGRHDNDHIYYTLLNYDSVIIMKAGSARPRLLQLLKQTQRFNETVYLAHIGREQEYITQNLDELDQEKQGDYFSLFLVTRQAQRNGLAV
ncbi:MAG TPA: precorrin-2 C(20)-methyltransferase [Thiothrix sp.]|nr:precorrin-2 C(20)-methyltransferase [Thiothrix sp.]